MATKKALNRDRLKEIAFIIIMAFPAISHLLIFWLGVQVESIKLAFTDVETGLWNNFENFLYSIDAIFKGSNKDMAEAFTNTFIFFGVMLVMLPLGLFAAYMLYKKMLFAGVLRLVLYLPGAISALLMTTLYQQLMTPDGVVFTFLIKMGWWDPQLSFKIEKAILYVLIYDIWLNLGSNLIIWLGTLSRIPVELLESAQLDGITPIKEFRSIILPLIWPTFVTMITLQLIGIFGASGSIMLLTGGQYGTFTLSYWLYAVVLNGSSSMYNICAATGLMFTIATIPLVVVGRKFLKRFGGAVEY